MEIVHPTDQVFLSLEKRRQPMHIATLQLFDFPEDAGPRFMTQLAEKLRSYTSVERPFSQRIVTRYGQDFWDEDRYFDLEHHFRHAALPQPGRIRELLAFVSAEHSNLMDRERPLWEAYLIEGLKDRQFAVYTKIHHAMMDGTSGVRAMRRIFSTEAETRGAPPLWALPPRPRTRLAGAGGGGSGFDIKTEIGKYLRAMPHLAKDISAFLFEGHRRDPGYTSTGAAPRCILNQKITGSRRYAAQSYSMPRIADIAKRFGGTLNDAVLAICGGALRDYLLGLDALPERPLVAMIPISLRDNDSEGGNEVAAILTTLGTDIADPAKRMEAVMSSVRYAKERMRRMSREEQQLFTALSLMPAGINMISGGRLPSPSFNLVISNIPGPKQTMYWNGARMAGLYPVAFLTDQMALNITLLSYCDQLEFGLTACRRTLPSMQRLLTHLDSALTDLEQAAKPAKRQTEAASGVALPGE